MKLQIVKSMLMANVIVLALSAFAVVRFQTINGVTWEYDDDDYDYTHSSVKIVGAQNAKGSITLPTTLGGKQVKSYAGLQNNREITSITIPTDLSEISNGDFLGCDSLTQYLVESGHPTLCSVDGILFSKNLATLKNYPIGKTELNWYTIPSSVQKVYSRAFYGCNIRAVKIPSSVTSIGDYAFERCKKLILWVDQANSKYSSKNDSLYNKEETVLICCPGGVTSVTIPSSVVNIPSDAFDYCENLTSIIVDSGNDTYSSFDGVLYDKSRSTLIRCPCGKSGVVNIPEGVIDIGVNSYHGGFYRCGSITKVSLPSTVKTLTSYAFSHCGALTEIEVANANERFFTRNGMLCRVNYLWDDYWERMYQDGERLVCCPGGRVSVVLPDTIRAFESYAFFGNSALKHIAIPESVSEIGSRVFEQCGALETILIPAGVKSMGERVFCECENLKSVIFGGGTGIYENSFKGCRSLKAIVCMGDQLAYGDYHYDSEWDWYSDAPILLGANETCRLIKKSGAHAHWPEVEAADWAGVPVDCITDPYPSDCVYCERVDDSILYYAVDAEGKTSICGAVSTKSIESGSHGSVVIPEMLGNRRVTEIGANAFADEVWLEALTIPTNIVAIGEGAFAGCSNFSTVVTQVGDAERVRSLMSKSGVAVKTIAFREYQKVGEEIWAYQVLDVGVKVLGVDKTGTSIIVPQELGGRTVVEIGAGAFENGESVKMVIIPSGVVSVGDDAFAGCGQLVSITFAGNAPSLSSKAFRSIPTTCVVYVRKSSAGWGVEIPGSLNGLPIQYQEDAIFTETKDGIQWISQFGGRLVPSGMNSVSEQAAGTVTLPESINGQRIEVIGCDLLKGATCVKSILIPSTVRVIEASAFERCTDLESVEIPEGVVSIGDNAFRECVSLRSVTIPSTVTNIGCFAFKDCRCLDVINLLCSDSVAKIGAFETNPPQGEVVAEQVAMTITNVVVNYIVNSVQPSFILPATYDTGFVNIIAEVKGGCVAVPATWTVNYPKFTEKFGSDFTKALAMQTGKKDGAGNPMFVWQDYVAGTDPTDETDVFTASITIVDGKVKVSYSPELDDARKALRKYTTWGKVKLTDKDWSVVGEGEEGNFNFFKVTVEMR